jgi:hypothetical protein
MPVTIPPFLQYQSPIVPLRGLWNAAPQEGDKFVNIEIDWGSYAVDALQFALSGNSPVAMSQIVALYVDNRRCGVDVDFLFPDSGFLLTVPAHAQGLFPVLTNALMFYAIGIDAGATDVTIAQVLNSMPPPIQLLPTSQQNTVGLSNIDAIASAVAPLIAPGINGTLNTISLLFDLIGVAPAGGSIVASLIDGDGNTVWTNNLSVPNAETQNIAVNLNGLAVRFHNGLSLQTIVAGNLNGRVSVNVYYTTP